MALATTYTKVLDKFSYKKVLTLCELIDYQNQKICLGLKKTGFGKGFYNGFGGKVEKSDKSVLDAAKRECREEAKVDLINCNKIGIIYFSFTYLAELFEVHVYSSTKWEGKPSESDEMKPEWFDFKDIPYDKMWKDDMLWMQYLLNNEMFIGAAYFDKGNKILNSQFKSINNDKDQIQCLLNDEYDKLDLDYSVLIESNDQEQDQENESNS